MDDFRQATFIFLSSHTGASLGRVDRRLLRVMEALVEAGATVNFICSPDSPAGDAAAALGVEVAGYRLHKVNYVRTRSRLKKYLKRFNPVVAHSTGFEADVLLRMAAEDLPVKVVNTIHCASWPARRSPRTPRTLRKRLDGKTLPRVDVLAVDCSWLAEQLTESGISVKRLMLDLPSVDLARVRREIEHPEILPAEGPWIGYAGRLEPARGLETLVKAGHILTRRRPGVTVAIAGDGPARPEIARLTSAAPGYWLPGAVSSVPAVLDELDVCCFPSNVPGTPTSLLEAAALGRPIVAADVPGISDLFTDGEEIVLVPPDDPKALATAVERLLDDPAAAEGMGERARQRTVDCYSSVAAVRRYLDLYRELMAG
jgi:glycosyltransferase involved in cell wall biosynthesis